MVHRYDQRSSHSRRGTRRWLGMGALARYPGDTHRATTGTDNANGGPKACLYTTNLANLPGSSGYAKHTTEVLRYASAWLRNSDIGNIACRLDLQSKREYNYKYERGTETMSDIIVEYRGNDPEDKADAEITAESIRYNVPFIGDVTTRPIF